MPKPTIVVDLDGVLASWNGGTFHTIGPPIEGAREFLAKLSEFALVVVVTCRTNRDLYPCSNLVKLAGAVSEWLRKHDMEQYVHDVDIGSGKRYAAGYIDDKGVSCIPEEDPDAFELALESARKLCCNGKEHPNRGDGFR